MHRPAALVAAGLVAAATLLGSTSSGAQDAVPAGWTSSNATVEGARLFGAMERAPSQILRREYTVTVGIVIARPAELPATCTVPTVPAPPPARRRVPFDVTPAFECNGAYPVAVTGTADQDGGTATLNRTIIAAMPAPAVTGVEVVLDGDAVEVTWDDMTAQAKDLAGYRVERFVDGGEPTVVTDVSRAPDGSIGTSARDSELPAQGEVLTYRVIAVRNITGPGGTGETSQSSITREGEAVDTPPSVGGGDGTPDPAAGGGGEGSTDGGGGGGRPARPQRATPPRVGITGSFMPPLLTPLDRGASAATTAAADDGYDEDLPYNSVDGPADADAPDDDLAAFFTDEAAGRGMAIPVATALVLAVWAFHLRVLARAAKPPA